MSKERARAFFDLVSEMRKAQKEYFKTRSPESLIMSKDLERQVDKEIQRANEILQNPKLF
jgi:hypothetical protein|nr:MAG TPA: hypothetical protein [Caudoviricetes sp.]